MANARWRTTFPNAYVRNLPGTTSHHCPIIIFITCNSNSPVYSRPFRVEFSWFSHLHFVNVVKKCWDSDTNFHDKIAMFKEDISDWNKNVFGNIFRKKNWILARLNGVQKAQCERFFHSLNCLEKDLRG